MRLTDTDAFEQDLKEKLLPLLVEKYGKEEAMKGLHFSLQDFISNIQSQPTITQPDPEWIPCSERLPEEAGTYLCTCANAERWMVTLIKWQPRMRSWNLTGARAYWKVVAWMPLPAPYRGEQK